MSNSKKCFNTLLNKAFFWSARSLAIAAVLILGKSDGAKAELNLAAKDESLAQRQIVGGDQVSYVEVGDVDVDGEDWPPPYPT